MNRYKKELDHEKQITAIMCMVCPNHRWMMIRANSTYFFIVDDCAVYIIYIISLGTKNQNAVT